MSTKNGTTSPAAQIMPFVDADLERLYTYGRFLELKLPQDPKKAPLKLDAETASPTTGWTRSATAASS